MLSGVLILGMHRSGTSCLAGCLQAAGLNLGPVNTKAAFNTKGNREHEKLRDLHEEILNINGYSWHSPPPEQLEFDSEYKTKITTILDDFRKDSNWGLKDPRAVFFARSWNILTDCRFVGTFRHPEEVAASLMVRGAKWGREMAKSEALNLWKQYNLEILNLFEQNVFPIIRYGSSPQRYINQITRLARSLGLDSAMAASFFENDLTHQTSPPETVPEDLRAVWDRLLSAEHSSSKSIAN